MNSDPHKQEHNTPHFVLVPLMAQGHMIPMSDLALLLARRGARVSLITTPLNARRLRAAADLASASRLPLHLVPLPFPCRAAGLPPGCENLDLVPSADLLLPFFNSLNLLSPPLKTFLLSHPIPPTCIIADQCMPWTMQLSQDLNIPRFVFHGPSCFFLLCTLKLDQHNLYENVKDDFEYFAVPDLPQRVEVNKMQAQRFFDWAGIEEVRRHVREGEEACDGIVLNTFYELESWYVDAYRRAVGKEVWAVGPVSACHVGGEGKAARGDGTGGVDYRGVLRWLEARGEGSVLYVNFGSIARTRMRILVEIGFGLAGSGREFVWVVRGAEEDEEVRNWVLEFGERNREKGVVITGWVPQLLMLAHPAVGGFMTHCGWNSTVEAVAAGVPMVTWPHYADQFLNEKLVVEVLRTGVAVGAKLPAFYQERLEEVMVRREQVEAAVRRVMCEGEEGDGIRERARELGEKARKAMENGGSSYENLSNLISHAMKLAESRV